MRTLTPLRELIQWRRDNGVSQAALARLVGTKAPTVSRWETGDTKPRMKFVARLCDVTGLPARVLRPDLAEIMEQ